MKLQARNSQKMTVETIDGVRMFERQAGNGEIRERERQAFSEQRRGKITGSDPGRPRHVQIRKNRQEVEKFFAILTAPAPLEKLGKNDPDEDDFVGIQEPVDGSLLDGGRTVEEWNPDGGINDDHATDASRAVGAAARPPRTCANRH